MDSMIAYCGLACDTCPVHLATLEKDSAKRHAMREEIARMCCEQYGMDTQVKDVTDCDGCTSNTGRLFSGCAKREIRKCAIGKGLTSCAYCIDYGCERLLKHFETDSIAQARLETIRNIH